MENFKNSKKKKQTSFAKTEVGVNLIPLPTFRYIYTQVRPSEETITNYVALLWIEVGQPCSSAESKQNDSLMCHVMKQQLH